MMGYRKHSVLPEPVPGGDDDILMFSNNRLDGLILMLMQLARELCWL